MMDDFNHTEVKITTDQRGHGLYSTIDAEPGDELIRISSPLVAIPESEALDSVCYHCFTDSSVANLKKCTGCNVASYCSKNCQRDSWKLIHKLECQILKEVSRKQKDKPLVTTVRAVMQILLKNKDIIQKHPEDKSWQQVGLVDHLTEMKKKDPERYDGLLLQSIAAKEFSKVGANIESVLLLFARMEMNTFRIHQGDNTPLGICFSPTLSTANHSCIANTFISFTGRLASLKALTRIQPGEELTISYIDPSFRRTDRQDQLERYYFTCTCQKCSEDWDNYTTCLKLYDFVMEKDLDAITARSRYFETKPISVVTPWERQDIANRGKTFITDPQHASIISKIKSLTINSPSLPSYIDQIPATQPIPTHLHTIYLHHLSNSSHLLALSTILYTIFSIDPILHPYPYHPTPTINIYIATKLLQEILYLEQNPPSLKIPKRHSKLASIHSKFKENYLKCVYALLVLLDNIVDKSHGGESRFAREIREMLGDVKGIPGVDGVELGVCFRDLRSMGECVGDAVVGMGVGS